MRSTPSFSSTLFTGLKLAHFHTRPAVSSPPLLSIWNPAEANVSSASVIFTFQRPTKSSALGALARRLRGQRRHEDEAEHGVSFL